MKLGQKAIEMLDQWGAFTDDRRQLVVEDDHVTVTGEVIACDTLSCVLSHIELRSAASAANLEQLRAWGDRIASRVRYLLEAIESVELDTASGRLLLRSTPPERKDDGSVCYYELLLTLPGELRLNRFRFDAKTRQRAPHPIRCTRELLEKLVNDLRESAP